MTVGVESIILSVLARLDESVDILDDAVEFGSPDFDLRKLIRCLLTEEAEKTILMSDIESILESVPLRGSVVKVYDAGDCRLIYRLPDDFLRLIYFRMNGWGYNLTRVSSSTDVGVSLKRYWRHRGKERISPEIVFTHHNGFRALEIIGSREEDSFAEGGYLPRPEITTNDTLLFPSSLRGELIDRIVNTIKQIRE